MPNNNYTEAHYRSTHLHYLPMLPWYEPTTKCSKHPVRPSQGLLRWPVLRHPHHDPRSHHHHSQANHHHALPHNHHSRANNCTIRMQCILLPEELPTEGSARKNYLRQDHGLLCVPVLQHCHHHYTNYNHSLPNHSTPNNHSCPNNHYSSTNNRTSHLRIARVLPNAIHYEEGS